MSDGICLWPLSRHHKLIVLLQIGTTSGGEREQEDFMYECSGSDVWGCFGRLQARFLNTIELYADAYFSRGITRGTRLFGQN